MYQLAFIILFLLSPPSPLHLKGGGNDGRPLDPTERKAMLELNFKWLQSRDYIERRTAAMSLGNLGDQAALQPLIYCLETPTGQLKEQEADVRYFIVEALGKLKNSAAVMPLIRRLSDPIPQIQGRAEWSLIQIGKPARGILQSQYDQAHYEGRQVEANKLWNVLSQIPQ